MQAGADALTIAGADSVTLYVTAATSFNGFDKSPSRDGKDHATLARKAMDEVTAKPLADVREAHRHDYQQYFRRVQLDLGDPQEKSNLPTDKRLKALQAQEPDNALAALYFQYGRYLLISSSRPGTQPANLQGIWNQDVRPAWSCNYTININAQMNYWPAETTNLAEMSLPLFGLIDALRVTGRDVAQAYYGAGGWCAHHNTDPWALANPVGAGYGQPALGELADGRRLAAAAPVGPLRLQRRPRLPGGARLPGPEGRRAVPAGFPGGVAGRPFGDVPVHVAGEPIRLHIR